MSAADVWMPLYIGDYLADTMRLNTAQHGAYLLLLMEQWRNGPLPTGDDDLARIVRCDLKEWRRIGPAVLRYFDLTDEGYVQRRLERERDDARANSDRRAEAGRKGAAKRWQTDSNANGNAIAEPMADGMRNQWPSPSPSPDKNSPPTPHLPVGGVRSSRSRGLRSAGTSPRQMAEVERRSAPPTPDPDHELWPVLRDRITAAEFRLWIEKMPMERTNGHVVFHAPTRFHADYVRQHWGTVLPDLLGRPVEIEAAV